jgi:hypothetical protein
VSDKSNEAGNGSESAFPQTSVTGPNGDFHYGTPGLTKRELFAAMAMQGMAAYHVRQSCGRAHDYAGICAARSDVRR